MGGIISGDGGKERREAESELRVECKTTAARPVERHFKVHTSQPSADTEGL